MKEPTINEKVLVRLLENAGRIYSDLPVERAGEAREFHAALDLAIAVINGRPAHRAGAGIDPVIIQPCLQVIADGARPAKKKGPASVAPLPSPVSTKPPKRISA